MRKLLFLSILALTGCSSTKEETITPEIPVFSENDIINQQDRYEFNKCVGISEGEVSRCENNEAICYIVHSSLTDTNSISCFKK